MHSLKQDIHNAFENRDTLSEKEVQDLIPHLRTILDDLDHGVIRVSEKKEGEWITHTWIKEAILLALRFFPMEQSSSEYSVWADKLPSKFKDWCTSCFQEHGFRAVPHAMARFGAYIAPKVVLMPSFVNVGAYIDEGCMIDTWATVGSCAQIGKNVHVSGGAGIAGVLEPLQNNPVIIEDDCFIGARSEIAEGVIVEQGSVISMGVFIGASTKIVDRATGKIYQGRIPAYSVVVPGTLPGKTSEDPHLYCAVIVKQVDAQTRAKTSINDLLRS